jgi:hypothetical protein
MMPDVGAPAELTGMTPFATGELSPAVAWVIVLSLAAAGLGITAMHFGQLITSLYAFGLLLGTIYSIPPLRLKRFPVPAFAIIATVRGFLLNFGVYYATRAALGLSFEWSPAIWYGWALAALQQPSRCTHELGAKDVGPGHAAAACMYGRLGPHVSWGQAAARSCAWLTARFWYGPLIEFNKACCRCWDPLPPRVLLVSKCFWCFWCGLYCCTRRAEQSVSAFGVSGVVSIAAPGELNNQ